jgi:hypothetical protein
MKSYVDAREICDPGHRFRVQGLVRVLLQAIKVLIRNATKQNAGVFAADFPFFNDRKERP